MAEMERILEEKRQEIAAARLKLDAEMERRTREQEAAFAARQQAFEQVLAQLDQTVHVRREQMENALSLMADDTRRQVQELRAVVVEKEKGIAGELAQSAAAERSRLQAETAELEHVLQGRVAAIRHKLEELEASYQVQLGQLEEKVKQEHREKQEELERGFEAFRQAQVTQLDRQIEEARQARQAEADQRLEEARRTAEQAQLDLLSRIEASQQELEDLEAQCRARSSELDLRLDVLSKANEAQAELDDLVASKRQELREAEAVFLSRQAELTAQIDALRQAHGQASQALENVSHSVQAREEEELARLREELTGRLREIEDREQATLRERLELARAERIQEYEAAHLQRTREMEAARGDLDREYAAASEAHRQRMQELEAARAAAERDFVAGTELHEQRMQQLEAARADYDREFAAAEQAHRQRMRELEDSYAERSREVRELQDEQGRLVQEMVRQRMRVSAGYGRQALASDGNLLRERILEVADALVRPGSIEDVKLALGELQLLIGEAGEGSWEATFLQPWLASFRRRQSQASYYWEMLRTQSGKNQHHQVLTIADLLLVLGIDGSTQRYEVLVYESRSVQKLFQGLKHLNRKNKGEQREAVDAIRSLIQRQEWLIAYDPGMDVIGPDAKIEIKTHLEAMWDWWKENVEKAQ